MDGFEDEHAVNHVYFVYESCCFILGIQHHWKWWCKVWEVGMTSSYWIRNFVTIIGKEIC